MVAGETRHPVVEESQGRVHDEWTQDLDLSLDPDREILRRGPARAPAGQRSGTILWMGFGLIAGMGLGLLVFGVVGVLVVMGAAMGGAFVLLVPTVDVVMPEPVAAQPVATQAPAPQIEAAPAEVAPAAAVKRALPKVAPAAPPVQPPVQEEVEAQLVVMPDPGFRSKPLDKAIEQLKSKGDAGKIGVVAGH
jgi:tetrahydromethanopterin S-methyltransferase subunit B